MPLAKSAVETLDIPEIIPHHVNSDNGILIFMETATIGAGCFWCTEAVMTQLRGVSRVVSGFSGGTVENPSTYRVYEHNTGHAEVVQVTFDPAVITYKQLLEVFFLTHNPTTLNRQDYDVGVQYRSVIFTHNEEQKHIAESVKQKLIEEKVYDQPIVSEIVPYTKFYPAEDYHQQYFERNGQERYCQVIISPKMAKLRAKFAELMKA